MLAAARRPRRVVHKPPGGRGAAWHREMGWRMEDLIERLNRLNARIQELTVRL